MDFFFDFLTPEVFDILVIGNIVVGVLIAGRRFFSDIRKPLHDDAPDWARAGIDTSISTASDS